MPNENNLGINKGYEPLTKEDCERTKYGGITPEKSAGILSKWTFSWFTSKIDDACDHVLELEEYYELPESSSPESSVPLFEKVWKEELRKRGVGTTLGGDGDEFNQYTDIGSLKKGSPSLEKALYRCFKREFYTVLGLVIVSNLLVSIQITLMRFLLINIQSVDDHFIDLDVDIEEKVPIWASLIGIVPQKFNSKVAKKGIFIVFIMTLISIMYPIFRQQETRIVNKTGRNTRSLLTGMVYRKILRMNSSMFRDDPSNIYFDSRNDEYGRDYCRKGSNKNDSKNIRLSVASLLSEKTANDTCGLSGSVVNLLSNDISRFSRLYHSHEFYSGIISILMAIFSLYFIIGVPGLVGMLIMALHIFWSVLSLNYRAYERKAFSEIRDRRILLTSEYLSCVKIIKSYSWEKSFVNEINKYRKQEVFSLLMQGIYWSLSTLCHAVVLHSTLVTILMFRYTGKRIDPANIFFALVFYDAVSEVVISFPKSYALFRDLLLSCERVKEFLLLPEREVANMDNLYRNLFDLFSRNEIDSYPGLVGFDNVELRWKDGCLLLSNLNFKLKSGELMGVIGPVGSGKSGLLLSIINELTPTRGKISIKGNCAYVPQLAWVFTGTIRENILFGSKYEPEWYNKVISACSLNEDLEMFPKGDQTIVGGRKNCLSGGQKQRISLARAVYKNSQIYVLDDCLSAVDRKVSSQIFKNCITGLLKDKCIILATHLLDILPQMSHVLLLNRSEKRSVYYGNPMVLAETPEFRQIFENFNLRNNGSDDTVSGCAVKGDHKDKKVGIAMESRHFGGETKCDLMSLLRNEGDSDSEEEDVEGFVTLNTYVRYILSCDRYHLAGAIVFGFVGTILNTMGNFYIGYWTEHFYKLDWSFHFKMFLGLSVVFPVVVVAGTEFFKLSGLNVSNVYHDRLIKHIQNAPLFFFENTQIGRILNRFTSDLVNVDELLPTSFNNATIAVITCGILLLSIGFVTPQFFICLPIIFYAFYYIVRKYPPILRQTERRSAALSAPITSQVIETITGLTTIHTFNTDSMLTKKLDDSVFLLNSVRYHVDTAYSWLNLRLETVASLTLAFSGVFGVLLSCCNRNYAGIFGTVLSFAVTLPGWLRYTVFTLGEFEADMVGFERIINYTESELTELSTLNGNFGDNKRSFSPNWPEKGKIEFKNVILSFDSNSLSPILKDISFCINSGERVGVVGRTGAGKSSLFTVLLRLYNPSSGHILIDDVDITSVPLCELRNRISIVPQDPIIFTGTIRFNLDPSGQFTDDELYNVLKRVHVYDYVIKLPGKLDHFFVSGGGTLSVGIKQLFCLARAVLRKSKILLLDEATSFIDVYTDSLIQDTIYKEFKDSTTITIAHRIKTVKDYDKVMVLDSGKIVEFDSPNKLLSNPNGMFRLLSSF